MELLLKVLGDSYLSRFVSEWDMEIERKSIPIYTMGNPRPISFHREDPEIIALLTLRSDRSLVPLSQRYCVDNRVNIIPLTNKHAQITIEKGKIVHMDDTYAAAGELILHIKVERYTGGVS